MERVVCKLVFEYEHLQQCNQPTKQSTNKSEDAARENVAARKYREGEALQGHQHSDCVSRKETKE
jgi:hypothetical protein